MSRPVTLFTGQWADMPSDTIMQKAKSFGYDGVELACWGDHFEVYQADEAYCQGKRELLERHGLELHAISNHLVGQAVCDRIDTRHESILPPHVWGDGEPEGVRQRAAEEMIATARAAKKLGIEVVTFEQWRSGDAEVRIDAFRKRLGDDEVYLSFDIDCIDPAFAPGTGTPVCGGFSSADVFGLLRRFAGVNLVGADVVEVLPALDPTGVTGLLAAHVIFEILSLAAVRASA